MSQKKDLFEYFVYLVYQWYCEAKNLDFHQGGINDLSKLKLIKLHFFACSTSDSALGIFNNFHALPYGHVESDVYQIIDQLNNFTITKSSLVIKSNYSVESILRTISQEDKLIIDTIVNNLKNLNYFLVSYTAFDLVELSHKWFSWQYSFEQAKKKDSLSSYIDKSLISSELKIYSF